MAQHGISETGFNIKTFQEIREDMKAKLMQVYDPASGETLQPDFDENDPFIQMVNAFCDELAALWQLASVAYGQFNPLVASGVSLSSLVQLNGITRQQGIPSTVVLTFTGEDGIVVPAGTIATDQDNTVEWATDNDVVVQGGEVQVGAKSTVNGTFSYGPGAINVIGTPVTGITSVVNVLATVPGRTDETDEALRVRRERSTETPSRGIAESIEGAVSNIEGVTYCKIFCNRGMETDEHGIPAKSIAVVVLGGSDEEIAKEIFNRAGIATGFYGSTVVTYTDSLGIATDVAFSRPEQVAIDVDVVCAPIEGSMYPADYAAQVRQAIVAFAQNGISGLGVTSVSGAFDDFGFPPSEDIVASRLYTAVNSVQGLKVVSLEIARHGQTPGTADVSIGWNQVGFFAPANIQVSLQQ